MIDQALNHIVDDLNVYLGSRYAIQPLVSLFNIANPDWKNLQPEATSTEQIFANLINVHEDNIYKNQPYAQGTPTETHPMRLDLYVLFAFKSRQYLQAIKLLSAVLEYYHRKPIAQVTLADLLGDPFDLSLEVVYHNIDLEDSNNMWGNLGGEQHPFAIYKIQLMELRTLPGTPTVPIQQVNFK